MKTAFKAGLIVGALIFFIFPASAEAAIQLVGTTTASGTNSAYNMSLTSLAGGIGSAPIDGDIVIVLNTTVGTADGNPGVGTAGYTEMVDYYNGVDTNDTNFSVNYKIMTSSPDTLVSCNASAGSTLSSVCAALVFRGVNITTPMDVASTTAASAQNTNEDADCPSIQPVTLGAVVVCTGGAAGAAVDSTVVTYPSTHTAAVQSLSPSDPGTVGAALGSYKVWASGAEDPAAYALDLGTANANSWVALTLVLRPIPFVPTVTTNFANAGFNSATLYGTKTGGDNATGHGFAYGTGATLSGGDTATTTIGALTSNSSFYSGVGGLSASITYYFRAYATNANGTGYGVIRSFVTGNSTATRTMRLFEGFRIQISGGKIILFQQ